MPEECGTNEAGKSAGWQRGLNGHANSGPFIHFIQAKGLIAAITEVKMTIKTKKYLRGIYTLALILPWGLGGVQAAEWLRDGDIANLYATSSANNPEIASDGTLPMVTWNQTDGTAQRTFVSRLNGSAWELVGTMNINLNQAAWATATAPGLAFTGSTPYVVWPEKNTDNYSQIIVKHYAGSWSLDSDGLNFMYSLSDAANPHIAFNGSTPYVTWEETLGGESLIFVSRYNGTDWAIIGNADLNYSDSQSARYPRIAVANGTPFVTWYEQNDIYASYYSGGWQRSAINTSSVNLSSTSDIAVGNNTPYVVWVEDDSIYMKHFNGSNWVMDAGRIEYDANRNAWAPRLAMLNNTPYVASYASSLMTNNRLYVHRYNGSGWEQVRDLLNVDQSQDAYNPSIAVANNTIYVSWLESNGTYNRVYVKHYDPLAVFTPTFTCTSTITPTRTATPTVTLTSTISPTITVTPTITLTSTLSPTSTISPTATLSPTATISPTITCTPTRVILQSAEPLAFPNPADEVVRFLLPAADSAEFEILVYNVNGERVQKNITPPEAEPCSHVSLDCRSLAPGVYYARINYNGRQFKTVKFAVVH